MNYWELSETRDYIDSAIDNVCYAKEKIDLYADSESNALSIFLAGIANSLVIAKGYIDNITPEEGD